MVLAVMLATRAEQVRSVGAAALQPVNDVVDVDEPAVRAAGHPATLVAPLDLMRRVRSGAIRCERPTLNGTPWRSHTGWTTPSQRIRTRTDGGTDQPAVVVVVLAASASRWIHVR